MLERLTLKCLKAMWLSELYGRIGQVLAEHGDMPVKRPVDLKLGDIVSSSGPFFIDLPSEVFSYEDYPVVNQDDKPIGRVKQFIIAIK